MQIKTILKGVPMAQFLNHQSLLDDGWKLDKEHFTHRGYSKIYKKNDDWRFLATKNETCTCEYFGSLEEAIQYCHKNE